MFALTLVFVGHPRACVKIGHPCSDDLKHPADLMYRIRWQYGAVESRLEHGV